MSLDPLECDHPKQLATNLLADLTALEMTPFPLKIFPKMIRKIKHADLKVFILTNSMEIAPKPQDSWLLSIDSCSWTTKPILQRTHVTIQFCPHFIFLLPHFFSSHVTLNVTLPSHVTYVTWSITWPVTWPFYHMTTLLFWPAHCSIVLTAYCSRFPLFPPYCPWPYCSPDPLFTSLGRLVR